MFLYYILLSYIVHEKTLRKSKHQLDDVKGHAILKFECWWITGILILLGSLFAWGSGAGKRSGSQKKDTEEIIVYRKESEEKEMVMEDIPNVIERLLPDKDQEEGCDPSYPATAKQYCST